MFKRLLYQIPAWLQWFYRGVMWRGEAATPIVYITFDDGPIPEVTPRILDILREKNVHATFFLVGDNVAKYPHLYQRILTSGHRVGNHTFHHIKGWRTGTDAYLADVEHCNKVLGYGAGKPPLFRPPYGRIRTSQKVRLLRRGYKLVLWDVLTHDYNKSYTPELMLDIVKRYTRPGSIIVFHDSLKSGDRMLATLPKVIDYLRAQGYIFDTL